MALEHFLITGTTARGLELDYRENLLENPGETLTAAIFSQLYDAYFPRIFSYLAYRAATREEAEDLTALVFEKVMTSYHQFDARRGTFEKWIFAIARNSLLNYYRHRQRHPQDVLEDTTPDEQRDTPPDHFMRNEEAARLRHYLERLNERDKELIALRFGAELSHRRIGEMLGMNENSVTVALSRAVRRLRTFFEKDDIR